MEYRIERLNKECIKDLEELHEAVYSKIPAKEYYEKKYDTSFTRVEYVGFIAYEFNEPIAFYGVIPCFIEWQNVKILAAQSADTMTHPLHRNKGLFKELSSLTLDLCRQLHIKLVFGFPNQNSYPGFIKFGWEMIGNLEFFNIKVDTLPLHSISNKIRFLQIPYNRWSNHVLEKYDSNVKGIGNSVVKDGFAGVSRTDEYKQYKSYSKNKVINILKSKVWIKPGATLLIGDMENVNETNFKEIIEDLKSLAGKLGLKHIQFHCSTGTSLHTLFSSIIDPVPSFPVIIKDFDSQIPMDQLKFTFADIDIF